MKDEIKDRKPENKIGNESQILPLGDNSCGLYYVSSLKDNVTIPKYDIANVSITPDIKTAKEINKVADFEFGQTPSEKELMRLHDRWFNLLRQRSPWKAMHSARVGEMSQEFASYLGATDMAAKNIGKAAKMHDIGCIWTPAIILDKPGKLDDEERIEMNLHANNGASVLVDMEIRSKHNITKKTEKYLGVKSSGSINYCDARNTLVAHSSGMTKLAASIALNHHEYEKNGQGIVDDVLYLFDSSTVSKMVSVCDFYDAIKHPRPYKKGNASKKTLEIMEDNAAEGKLDKKMFEHFKGFMGWRDKKREKNLQDGVTSGIEIPKILVTEMPLINKCDDLQFVSENKKIRA